MRSSIVFALTLACLACSTGPGDAPSNIGGTWASQSSQIPAGTPTRFTFTQSDTVVSGTASWTGDTVGVSGTYERPQITVLRIDNYTGISGLRRTYYTGKAIDNNTLMINGKTYLRQQ